MSKPTQIVLKPLGISPIVRPTTTQSPPTAQSSSPFLIRPLQAAAAGNQPAPFVPSGGATSYGKQFLSIQKQQRPVNMASLDTIDHTSTKMEAPARIEGGRYSRGAERRGEGGLLGAAVIGSAFGRPRASNASVGQGPVDAYGSGGAGASRTLDVGKGLLDTESPYALKRDSHGGDANSRDGTGGRRMLKSSMSVRALNPGTTQNETVFDEARAKSVS